MWTEIANPWRLRSRPVARIWQQGGQKPDGGAEKQTGGHIFQIQNWMHAATGLPNVKWGARISNGGRAGTTAPPLAMALLRSQNS